MKIQVHCRLLILRSPSTLQVASFFDSDFTSDKNDRNRISRYVSFIRVCLVSWYSKFHNCVTLPGTEAEYVAMSSATSEKIKFVTSVLGKVLGKPPPLPSLLREDNTGNGMQERKD